MVDETRRQLSDLLTAETDWLVDNILAAGAPEAVRVARAAGRRVTVLVHYFPADEIGWTAAERDRSQQEAEASTAASAIVTTSRWTAAQVEGRYAPGPAVAVPGVQPAPLSPGSARRTSRLIWLGRHTRTKDPLTLVQALTRLDDLDWTAQVVGAAVDRPGLHAPDPRQHRAGRSERAG